MIDWLDSFIFALELLDTDEEESDLLWSNQRDFPGNVNQNEDLHIGPSALKKLSDILTDLRYCNRNTILDRSLKNKKGRPKDNKRSESVKNEAARLYKYLRDCGNTVSDSCEIINATLQYLEQPIMTVDVIRKRSYKVPGYPNALALRDTSDKDNEDELIEALREKNYLKTINVATCYLSLNNIVQKRFMDRKSIEDFFKSTIGK